MSLLAPLLLISSFIQIVYARRGGGGGVGSGGSSASTGGIRGSQTNSGFELESFGAALFALSIIFAVLTVVQTLWLLIQNRKSRKERFVLIGTGRIFSTTLFFSLLSLLATYIFRAIYTGVFFNTRRSTAPNISESAITAWAAITYLTDILLILAVFSFISTRYKSFPQAPSHLPKPTSSTTNRRAIWVKHAIDGIFILVLIGLAAAYIGLRTRFINRANSLLSFRGRGQLGTWVFTLARREIFTMINLSRAYWFIMLVAVISIGISALLVYARARKVESHIDTKAMFYIMSILTPSYVLYVLFEIIFREVYNPRVNGRLNSAIIVNQLGNAGLITRVDWDLAGLIISGITKLIIISVCLFVRNLRTGSGTGTVSGNRELNVGGGGKKVDDFD